MTQLAEWWLLITEDQIQSLANLYNEPLYWLTVEKSKIKKKRPGMAQFLKNNTGLLINGVTTDLKVASENPVTRH